MLHCFVDYGVCLFVLDTDDDAAVCSQGYGGFVVHLAYQVYLPLFHILGDGQGGRGLLPSQQDFLRVMACVMLYPPHEIDAVAIGVEGGGGVEGHARSGSGRQAQRGSAVMPVDDDDGVAVAFSFGRPLHACGEVVERVGVEPVLIL